MRISIVQSCYIPWKGFFDLVSRSDMHVVYDEMQFVKRHWHNRNRIMTASGPVWLTIPVLSKSKFEQPINAVGISERWAMKHWRTIELAYGRAPFFRAEADRIRALYETADRLDRLSDINRLFLAALLERLSISSRIVEDRDFHAQGRRSERLLDICVKAGAKTYLSGPSARSYLDEDIFRARDISVEWMQYGPYAEYRQSGPSFDHAVSVLDVLFNLGPDAAQACRPRLAEAAE